jgi:hypothetical protein
VRLSAPDAGEGHPAAGLDHRQRYVLGKPHILIIDEGFWAKGIRGIEQEEGQKRLQQ